MENSETILAEVKELYQGGAREYRDVRIEVGRKIHEYIFQFLNERPLVDAVTRRQHRDGFQTGKGQIDFRRRDAVNKCSAELGITTHKVGNIIRVSMTVDLLSDGGNIGDLAWATILEMTPLIARTPSGEEWKIDPRYDGVALFRKAVELNLPRKEVREWIVGATKRNNSTGIRGETERVDPHEQDFSPPTSGDTTNSIKPMLCGSPRDAAEIILDLIRETDDPKAILLHLQAMVESLPKKRRLEYA